MAKITNWRASLAVIPPAIRRQSERQLGYLETFGAIL
jgi:hypothetical protein